MTGNEPDDEKGRIVPFRRTPRPRAPQGTERGEPVEDLGKYAQDGEPDDYRQRMINNGLALAALVILGAIGVWLAISIAEMRKNQDCVLSGRRDCAKIVVPQR
jgi:hypothetical protein